MISRPSNLLLVLLITLTVLSFAVPGSLAQEAAVGATEETTLSVDSVGDSDGPGIGIWVERYLVDEFDELVLVPGDTSHEIFIRGSGFVEGATVEFRRVFRDGGVYTVTPSSGKITVVNSGLIRVLVPADVWLNESDVFVTGSWDVQVTNPNGHSGSLDDGLAVDVLKAPSDEDDGSSALTCIIATAAYGSEMAPEVQFLRGFRDDTVLSTFAGSSFMDAFNSFYYSWSPGVADSIRDVEEAKAFTRGMIVPLLGVLSVSFYAYNLFSFSPELGVIVAGFLASSMLGAIYMTLPTIALLRLAPRSKRNMILRRGIVALLGLSSMGFAITSLAVYSSSSSLAMFGSATLVLSSMFVAALMVSSLVLAVVGPTYLRMNSMWHVITDPTRVRRE